MAVPNKSLSIGMPIPSFLPSLGGMEVGLHNIARGLVQQGHRPIVFTDAAHVRALRQMAATLPYRVVPFPPKALALIGRCPPVGLAIFSAFFAWARWHYRIDVWHGTMGYPIGVALAHYARGRPIPALVRCAGGDIQIDETVGYGLRRDPVVNRLVEHWLPKLPLLVAITDSMMEEYTKLGIPDERIIRIPNGVNLKRFRVKVSADEVRRRYDIPEDTLVYLSVARNHPKKNLRAVIEAAAILKERGDAHDFVVMIVGRDVTELRDVAAEVGILSQVRLVEEIGSTDDEKGWELPGRALIDIYCTADIFVFPSFIESFGIAIVEAMAAGLPVIVGDSPGCRDVVDRGAYGLMVAPEDRNALAVAMHRLAVDGSERKRLGRLSLERAAEYDWDSVIGRYLDAYDQLLGGRAV